MFPLILQVRLREHVAAAHHSQASQASQASQLRTPSPSTEDTNTSGHSAQLLT